MMGNDELDDLREEVESYLDDLEPNQPFIHRVHQSITTQLELVDGKLRIVVEVASAYDYYDELGEGDEIEDAPGDLREIGEVFVTTLEDRFDESIELTLEEKRGETVEDSAAKLYRDRISL